MTREEKFQQLLGIHEKWGNKLIFSEIIESDQAKIYLSEEDPSCYYNYATPKTEPEEFNWNEFDKVFSEKGKNPALYLSEENQANGFLESAVRHNFKIAAADTWLLLDTDYYKTAASEVDVTNVTQESFDDYKNIMNEVFADYPGNEGYLEMCRKVQSGEARSGVSDFVAEFYLINDGAIPVSGAGMFYSKRGGFAYLHNTGTLKAFRGRGYQTSLVRHRIDKALSLGVTNIYSLVEHGEQSWRNLIKVGFKEAQVVDLMSKAAS